MLCPQKKKKNMINAYDGHGIIKTNMHATKILAFNKHPLHGNIVSFLGTRCSNGPRAEKRNTTKKIATHIDLRRSVMMMTLDV